MPEMSRKTITEEEIRALGTYTIEQHHYLKDINCDSYVLRHIRTGARIALLPNEDSNKVFFIGFRTPPVNSTGVAHIIEHTVLCGSRDFPVKDPFIELVKGSLNTFLNAMTYSDKTVYPAASTNDKDFANLMHVYLDAVFHPNIYTEQNIFRQEGWHYEMQPDENGNVNEDSPIIVNGVVYNEMKGVMSSADDVLADKVLASLYPHTTYANVSGGDPEVIPDLTYEEYLDFHRKYYHPSNSYIYLYGDMDMAERLRFLDEAYLSRFDHLDVDSSIGLEPAFAEPVEQTFNYSILADQAPEGMSYLSDNYSIDVRNDVKENLAFKILDYVLCDREGAPVKEAVRHKGIGQDLESLYEAGIRQPFYSITAKYTDPDKKEEFLSTIRETLEDLVQSGIDRRSLQAGISYFEFSYREADFGTYPKGLIFGLDAMDSWLYDDNAVWENLEIGDLFDELRKDAENGYFERLIEKHLLKNTHRSVILLLPEQGLTEKKDAERREKMARFAASLSKEERLAILEEEKALRVWQETPDTEEDIRKIPVLKREDLGHDILPYVNEERTAGDVRVLAHPIFTSGIDYTSFIFDITDMPEHLFKYLGVFKTLIGVLDTERYSYTDLDIESNILTGGITPSIGMYSDAKDRTKFRMTFEISMKALHENLEKAMELISEIVMNTKYTNHGRILEVLEEELSANKSELPASGHVTAITRASSYFSMTNRLLDEVSGIGAYRILDRVVSNFEKEKEDLTQRMNEIVRYIFQKDRLLFNITAGEKEIEDAMPFAEAFGGKLFTKEDYMAVSSAKDPSEEVPYRPALGAANEAFTTAGQIQFVCRAGNYLAKGLPFTGALRVLKVILGYDYLWNRIRVKGGAYGCMSGFGKDGTAYFVSYRDPHLTQTIDAFKEAAEYIRHFEADETAMTKYVIGAISALDKPLSPNLYGRYSLSGYMIGTTEEMLHREREETLAADVDTIRSLADYLDAFMNDECLCVVGNAEKIGENRTLFKEVEPLV